MPAVDALSLTQPDHGTWNAPISQFPVGRAVTSGSSLVHVPFLPVGFLGLPAPTAGLEFAISSTQTIPLRHVIPVNCGIVPVITPVRFPPTAHPDSEKIRLNPLGRPSNRARFR